MLIAISPRLQQNTSKIVLKDVLNVISKLMLIHVKFKKRMMISIRNSTLLSVALITLKLDIGYAQNFV